MSRIYWITWITYRADFWHTGTFLAWLGLVQVLGENSHIWRNRDVIVTFLDFRKFTLLATVEPIYMLDALNSNHSRTLIWYVNVVKSRFQIKLCHHGIITSSLLYKNWKFYALRNNTTIEYLSRHVVWRMLRISTCVTIWWLYFMITS